MLIRTTLVMLSLVVLGCSAQRPGVAATPTSEPSLATPTSQVSETADSAGATEACWGIADSLFPPPEGTPVLAAAFETSPAAFEAWKQRLWSETGVTHAGVLEVPTPAATGEVVGICYWDGDFGRPRGDPPDSMPNYSRIIVVIHPDRTFDTQAMGFIDRLPILDPNKPD